MCIIENIIMDGVLEPLYEVALPGSPDGPDTTRAR